MFLESFLKLVEIQTKVASMVPFLIGTIYSLYRFHAFDLKNFIFMLLSLLMFDMATTAINNYIDYKKANKTYGYNYEKHNAIVGYNMKETTVIVIISVLIMMAVLFGYLLFLNTSVLVLVLGIISFVVGVLYSFGPVPISRMPLGELFSGLFMGFVIVFISAYIHVYDENIVVLMYESNILSVHVNILEVFYIFLVSVPAVIGIANIMLANNICDIEDDIENKRYTLPVYIGKEAALKLFKVLYYLVYINLVILLILKIIPLAAILVLLTIILIQKNIEIFYKLQTKKDTFVLSVKNFIIMNGAYIITICAATIINYYKGVL